MGDIGLSATELSDIRNDVQDLLPDTCTIQQVSLSTNAIGEPEKTYSTRAANVSCRLDPERGWEYLGGFADISKYMGKWVLTLPYDQTIEETDRVIIGSYTFEVDHVDEAKSWAASVRCLLERVEI